MTLSLLKELQEKYPNHEFTLLPKEDIISHFQEEDIKDLEIPDELIIFSFNEMSIYDPYSSECSRFKVEPRKEYKIFAKDAKKIINYNKITIHN